MIDRHSLRQNQGQRHRVLRSLALGLALATLAGCNLPVSDRGNLPKPELLAQVKPGVTDKNSVKALLGTPSSVATFDGDTWYYISREVRQVAFLKPEVLDQEVYAVHFDDKGIVSNISHAGLRDSHSVTPNADATPAQGREFTFLEQLIGNFGKFNTGTDTKGAGPGGPGGP
ncbi:MAG TPA: outer membrane protein assembly factor BamE [Stellaceae bacterium]|jgi:outer membrane protein assembly factor BamE (lipoprotein component of BamABCDE complex)|nr:outer membrane protein assembly factor BamE [Stellaceae bacterium]